MLINECDYDPETMEIVIVKKERRTTPPTTENMPTVEEVAEAIKELDEDNDELWTENGDARTKALSDALGKPVSAALREEAYTLLEQD